MPWSGVGESAARDEQLRRALNDVHEHRHVTVAIELEGQAEAVTYLLREIVLAAPPVSEYRLHLAAHVVGGSSRLAVLEALGSTSPSTRAAAARACCLLRAAAAIPALGALLEDGDAAVRRAAAEALGRIGGDLAADQLLRILKFDRPGWPWLLLAFVRAASDRYIDSNVAGGDEASSLVWLTLAAGIRRRAVARQRLIALLGSGEPLLRASACRGLGWIHVSSDATALEGLLGSDPEPYVREAAARALRLLWKPASPAGRSSAAANDQRTQVEGSPRNGAPSVSASVSTIRSATHEAPAEPKLRTQPRHAEGGRGAQLAAVLHLVLALRPRSRERAVNPPAPLSPQDFVPTPHRYKPDPSLLDGHDTVGGR